MKVKKLEVGVKYKGYGTLNEFGEFEFVPEDTGAKAGVIKQVTTGDGYAVSSSKKYILVHLKVKRNQSKLERVKQLTNLYNNILQILHRYDF